MSDSVQVLIVLGVPFVALAVFGTNAQLVVQVISSLAMTHWYSNAESKPFHQFLGITALFLWCCAFLHCVYKFEQLRPVKAEVIE